LINTVDLNTTEYFLISNESKGLSCITVYVFFRLYLSFFSSLRLGFFVLFISFFCFLFSNETIYDWNLSKIYTNFHIFYLLVKFLSYFYKCCMDTRWNVISFIASVANYCVFYFTLKLSLLKSFVEFVVPSSLSIFFISFFS
jgi:hypothetical protein